MRGAQLERGVSGPGSFGVGGDEPYERALREQAGTLRIRAVRVGATHPEAPAERLYDVADWLRPADHADLSTLDGACGPVLDVGCGPGRMVRAACERGLPALGVDISAGAVRAARGRGVFALQRSVFEGLPLEGQWMRVLLLDGNIGIGGDPVRVLSRCRELVAVSGCVVVEVESLGETVGGIHGMEQGLYSAVDADGHESLPFAWARVGSAAIEHLAAASGLTITARWHAAARSFITCTPT